MITMNTTTQIPVTGIRYNPRSLARAKYAARMSKISLTEYMNNVLDKATEDIRTEEELEEERKLTEKFLSECAGTWGGDKTTEEIMDYIREGRSPREVVKL